MRAHRVVFAAVASVFACAACTLGPEYRRPEVEKPVAYPAVTSAPDGLKSVPVVAPFDGARWWRGFDDPVLDELMTRAEAQNLDVQTAALRIAEARTQRDATAGKLYPTVSGSGLAGRARLSENSPTSQLAGGSSNSGSSGGSQGVTAFNAFQLGFDAYWEADLFGGTRRQVQSAEAQVVAAEEARRGALVSTTAELGRAYFELRGAERRLAIVKAEIGTQEQLGKLIESRNKVGFASSSDVATQTAQVSQAEALLPPIEQAVAQARNRVALLLALPPGGVADLLDKPTAWPPLPPRVPVGLPGDLLERRPDVRQREAELRSRVAQVGAAKAALFPSIALGASGGFQSSQSSSLLDWASRFLLGGLQVSIPIFQGGQLRAQVTLADYASQEAALAYRDAVVSAYHDADNALTAYDQEQRHAAALSRQLDESRHGRDLAKDRYEAGLGAFIDVLNAEQMAQQADLQLAQSETDARTDLIAVYKALGGGWSDPP